MGEYFTSLQPIVKYLRSAFVDDKVKISQLLIQKMIQNYAISFDSQNYGFCQKFCMAILFSILSQNSYSCEQRNSSISQYREMFQTLCEMHFVHFVIL